MSDFINNFLIALKTYAYFLCVCPKKRLLSNGSLSSHFANQQAIFLAWKGLEIH